MTMDILLFEKYLKTLELETSANLNEIKSAYRKLVKVHHPDLYKNPENIEKAAKNFKIITKAFEYLKDNYVEPEERKILSKQKISNKISEETNTAFTYSNDINDYVIYLLNECIEQKLKIEIIYQTSSIYKNRITKRIVLPMELYLGSELKQLYGDETYNYIDDKIYLIAHCEIRNAKRTFRLDRILSIRVLIPTDNIENEKNFNKRRETKTKKGEPLPYGCFILIIFLAILYVLLS